MVALESCAESGLPEPEQWLGPSESFSALRYYAQFGHEALGLVYPE
jgi:hypothetical protein